MTYRFALAACVLVLPPVAAAQDRICGRESGIADWTCPAFRARVALLSAADPAGASATAPHAAIPTFQFWVPETQAPVPGAQSPAADGWFGPDKVRHFFTSALLQSLGYGTLRAMDVEHGAAIAGASTITAAFGIGKELRDRRRGYGFSSRDLVWDAAGAAAASVLLVRTER